MKIKLNLSSEYREKEIVINAAQKDDEVQQILDSLKDVEEKFNHLNGYLGETVYSLALKDILFFETNDRNVYAHTTTNAFLIHYRLYELEENLPDNFLRVSKSSILNIDEILSLSRSVTGNLVQFRDSYKQIYVSRRFLKELKERLKQRSFKHEK
ncbi:LytTR family transcriptional regulator [Companilactobacillus zhachilii]|uniref:LytTR family transcriptional regulator n=1 Tax=Companilactobacillus zhachilii TaxID=2304606 RepID=A0A386PUI3_9LACO|nr:LytTR family DNA-binding domain-containing protein [Companilactobacillus zhachilii]AYE39232.1 LytTR family transcriptional regulator [Companilactobacillus zhachilii]